MNAFTEKTLAEHLRISEADIVERKELLGITPKLEKELGAFHEVSHTIARDVVEELYAHQVTVPSISAIIGDSDTLRRLKSSMCTYIVQLFSGVYGADYVNARLRIGKVHARIGVAPHLYVSTVHRLQNILTAMAINNGATPVQIKAVHKMILFDLELVFDTYIQGLVSEVELGRDKLIQYSETLEDKVFERTSEVTEMARTDELTGLRNRREFFGDLKSQVEDVHEERCSLALIFMDIDNFKTVNDTQGHVAGDTLLRTIGANIRTCLIGKGSGYRYGGDEFCALLRDATREDAHRFVENLASMGPSELQFSSGISVIDAGTQIDASDFVRLADKQMYEQKTQRKNEIAKQTKVRAI
ncbi:MAG: GGDEF domain-containing protein [Maritimibacter sp.]